MRLLRREEASSDEFSLTKHTSKHLFLLTKEESKHLFLLTKEESKHLPPPYEILHAEVKDLGCPKGFLVRRGLGEVSHASHLVATNTVTCLRCHKLMMTVQILAISVFR
ncbi:MAG: hypothetical protein JWL77_6099 [Chthonomonadaceae bacterium]|nr:hypothetical protein [Chthonomonadaceae bacterium]